MPKQTGPIVCTNVFKEKDQQNRKRVFTQIVAQLILQESKTLYPPDPMTVSDMTEGEV